MSRRLTRVIQATLASFMLLTVLFYLLFGTQAGSRLILESATRLSHGQFTFKTSRGSLLHGLRIHDLHWQDPSLQIRIAQMGLAWQPLDLFMGRIGIRTLKIRNILIDYHAASGKGSDHPSSNTPHLPLAIRLTEVRAANLIIVTSGHVFRLARISGQLDLSGDRLNLPSLSLVTPQGRLVIRGQVQLNPSPQINLNTAWRWSLAGQGQFSGHGNLQGPFSRMTLHQQLDSPFQARLAGHLDLSQFSGTARLSWDNAHWPLIGKENFSSPSGQLMVSGNFSSYHMNLKTGFSIHTLRITHLEAHVSGNRKSLVLETEASLLGSTLKATGKATLSPTLTWQIRLDGQHFNPGKQWKAWPGQVGIALHLKGNAREIRIPFIHLEGRLRHHPLSVQGRGSLNLENRTLLLASTRILSMGSTLNLEGQVSPERGRLHFHLDIPALQILNRQAAGYLKASGKLDGPWTWPRISLQLDGHTLRFRHLEIDEIHGEIHPISGHNLQCRLDIKGLTQGQFHFNELEIDARGNPENHQLTLSTQAARTRLDLAVNGRFQVEPMRWDGRISRLQIQSTDRLWQLNHPAAIILSRHSARLSPTCLVAAHQTDAHLCASVSDTSRHLELSADWMKIPLALIEPLLPVHLHVGGHLSGHATLSGTPDKTTGSLTTKAPDAFFSSDTGRQKTRFPLDLKALSASLDGQRIAIHLKAELATHGKLDAQIDNGLDDHSSLQASARVVLPSLTGIAPLFPELQDVAGSLHGLISVHGSRAHPIFSMKLTLSNGVFTLPGTGVHLSAVNATLTGHPPDNPLLLNLGARSGPGTLKVTGTIHGWPGKAPSASLRIDGQRFEAVNLPQVTALVSPELTVNASLQKIRIRGQVNVPEASIHIRQMPPGAVDVSGDAQIQGASPSNTHPVKSDIQIGLMLGHAVKIDALGLSGQLQGNLQIAQEDRKPATANGGLKIINGTYAAYGLKLAISRGIINFAGPLDNPGLDFIAERQTGNVTAQLAVTGTLKSPHSQVSAQPPMSESEALSWLITGHGLAGSSKSDAAQLLKALASMHLDTQGGGGGFLGSLKAKTGLNEIGIEGGSSLQQSALLLGKYLTPDLYIRYATGLFEHSNTLTLTYHLTQHFRIEARSGTAQGIDLLYQIIFG